MKKESIHNDRIQQAAHYIARRLIDRGCLIHRYDAKSTSTVYLKVDAGVACTLRISDHDGKSNLKFRFNYMVHEQGNGVRQEQDDFDRFYYQTGALEQMIADIVELRDQRCLSYFNYQELIDRNLFDSMHQKGFWSGAYCVNNQMQQAA